MGAGSVDGADTVIAGKTGGGQALASVGRVDYLVLDRLVLKVLVVLAVFISYGAHFLRGLRGQIVVGGGVGKDDFLAGRDADFALEEDEVFLEGVLGGDEGLLLRLELDSRSELIEIRDGPGFVGGADLAEQQLVSGFEGAGIVNLA